MVKYITFEMIEDEYPLTELLNRIMSEMNILRMSCAPRNFNSDRALECLFFYDTCLWETYFHELHSDLVRIMTTLIGYQTEFDSNWLKYSRFKRDSYGIDEEYQEEEENTRFGVMYELKQEDSANMARDTSLDDLKSLFEVFKEFTSLDLMKGLSETTGIKFQRYKQVSNGDIVPMSTAEVDFNQIKKELSSEDLISQLKQVVKGIRNIYKKLKTLPENENNEDELFKVMIKASDILHLKFKES